MLVSICDAPYPAEQEMGTHTISGEMGTHTISALESGTHTMPPVDGATRGSGKEGHDGS